MTNHRKQLEKLSDKLVKDATQTFGEIINVLEQWEAENENRDKNQK